MARLAKSRGGPVRSINHPIQGSNCFGARVLGLETEDLAKCPDIGNFCQFLGKLLEFHWPVTVMSGRVLRYCLTSDIFGLAYLVGQIEDELPLGSTGSRGSNQEKKKETNV